jgi:hypothetical protein
VKRQIISALITTLILVPPAFSSPKSSQEEQTTTEITIRIRDYAHSQPLVLHHAEQVASTVLRKAGVATRWVDCPVDSSGSCASDLSTLDFVVNVLPYSMSDRLRRPGGVLGFAIEGGANDFGFIASVFYDVVKNRAAEHLLEFGELLGDAIAHELGHLLLGTNSHSSMGLMSAFWSGNYFRLASQGQLTFSDAEVKRIEASMNARTLAAREFNREGQTLVAAHTSE